MLLLVFLCTVLQSLAATRFSPDEKMRQPLIVDIDTFASKSYQNILDALKMESMELPAPVSRFSLSSFTPFCGNYVSPEVADDVIPECVRWEVWYI